MPSGSEAVMDTTKQEILKLVQLMMGTVFHAGFLIGRRATLQEIEGEDPATIFNSVMPDLSEYPEVMDGILGELELPEA